MTGAQFFPIFRAAFCCYFGPDPDRGEREREGNKARIHCFDMSMDMSNLTRSLAAIGTIFLQFASVALGKLILALKYKCDFASALATPPSKSSLANKIFWITGASSGIGRSLALHLCSAHNDVKLILSSRKKEVLEEVAAECRQKAGSSNNRAEVKVLTCTLDLADHSSLTSKAEQALSVGLMFSSTMVEYRLDPWQGMLILKLILSLPMWTICLMSHLRRLSSPPLNLKVTRAAALQSLYKHLLCCW